MYLNIYLEQTYTVFVIYNSENLEICIEDIYLSDIWIIWKIKE